MAADRWRLHANAPADRLIRAAAPLLIVRVLEGLVAWLFFNLFFTADSVRWEVQGAFATYLVLNLAIGLRYWSGAVSWPLLCADMAVNVATLGAAIAASGGDASPLLLLLALKAIPYALVFGIPAALCFAAMAAVLLAALWSGLVPVVPVSALAQASFAPVMHFAAVEAAISAFGCIWLRAVTSGASTVQRMRAAERHERDAAPAAVANALLTVSEAVSSLTRLDEILEKVAEIAPRSIDMDYCGIALYAEESGKYVRAVAAVRERDAVSTELHLTPDQVPDFEWVRHLGHCAVVPVSESLQVAPNDVPAVLIAPLLSSAHFFGVMEFARRSATRSFTQRDMAIADGVARQTAVAIERARLVEESRRLVRAVESTEEAVLITDAQRRIIFANLAFTRTLGYRRDEIMGRDALEIAGHFGEEIGNFQDALVRRRSWRGETSVRRKDGATIPIMLNASLIRDGDGRVQGAVAILEDISEEKRFQEQMQRADRLAAVGETAAGIAHEINNALAVIFGQTGRAEERGEAELRAALLQVDGQARRIADIVQGVLGFARPRAPRSVPVDLVALTQKTLELVRHDLVRQHVRLDTRVEPELPAAQADPQQLQQVLLNLIGNAVQAMAGTTDPWLRVEVARVADQLAVRVIDGGPGIAGDVLARVFDPFFSTKAEGSGLGLSVSYAIARAHGGDLQVQSEIGRGTTFTLLLPVSAAEATIERALLVDDDPDVAEAVTAMLVKEGLQVERAATGAEGLARLESGSWDAVFLDVRLPDLGGPEIYRRLTESRPELAQRVVFITGGVWRSESRLRHELPPQPVLAKPCTQDDVRAVLRRLRGARRQAA